MKIVISFLCYFLLFFIAFYAFLGIIFSVINLYLFRRVKRPDYSITAGEYCLNKMRSPLKRKDFFYRAGDSLLKGYFYPSQNSDKLIILCHGFRSGADDFLPLIKELLALNYNVFSYDVTATFDSKGRSLVGMQEWLIDLDNTLNYIKNSEEFKHFKLYLIGHSLGGYAVLSILSFHKNIRGVVALAPVNDAGTLMIETARLKIGGVAYLAKPFFDFIKVVGFGKYSKYNSLTGINSTTIPVLLVQGDKDRILTGNLSIFSTLEKITNSNVKTLETKGVLGGHDTLWHSETAVNYKNKVDHQYKLYKKQFGFLKRSQKIDYFKDVDDSLYSEASEEIVKAIDFTFSTN